MLDLLKKSFHGYGLLIGLGVFLAFEVVLWLNKKKIEEKNLENAFWWMMGGGVLGARLYHVIDFWNRYYQSQPLKVFYVWEGGLGIWGAILGAIISLYIFARIKRVNFLLLADLFVSGAPLAQAIGRIGNWVNGEIVGKNGEPLFAYEAVLNLILFTILVKIYNKNLGRGKTTGIYLIGYGIIRITLENLRPQNIIWSIYGIPTAVIAGVISVIFGIILFSRKDNLHHVIHATNKVKL